MGSMRREQLTHPRWSGMQTMHPELVQIGPDSQTMSISDESPHRSMDDVA
jgi:hypothetical protein